MNISKLEKLISEKKLSKTKLAEKVGFTRPTLDNILSGGDAKISTVKAIADYFGKPIGYFFDEEDFSSELAKCKAELQVLKDKLASSGIKSSHVFLAVPLDDDEFLDLRKMKDKVIRILSK